MQRWDEETFYDDEETDSEEKLNRRIDERDRARDMNGDRRYY